MRSRYFVKPTPTEAPVVTNLRNKNLLIDVKGEVATFKCPQCHENAHYVLPSEELTYGTVKCTCQYSLLLLLKFLDMKWHETRICPTITISNVPIFELADAAEEILAKSGKIVACGRSLYAVDFNSGHLSCLDEADLIRILSKLITFIRFDARSKTFEPVDPPTKLVRLLLGSQQRSSLPNVYGVLRQPYLRDDGSLCLTPGYEATLQTLAAFDPQEYRSFAWSSHLSKSDAEEALQVCEDLYRDFCSNDESIKSAFIGAGLLAVQRGILRRAPMILIQGNAPGTGKSTLGRIYTRLATPEHIAESSYPENPEEAGKHLLAALSNAPGAIFYDNIEGALPAFPALCTCLTEPLFERRVLQRSALRQVITRSLFVGTGNFISPQRDLKRRVLPIKLIAPNEHPEQRHFDRDIDEYLHQHRSELVMQHLKITAAYLSSREKVHCRSLVGLDDFTRRCREPLIWLGRPDPAEGMLKALDEGDEEILKRHLLLQSLKRIFEQNSFTVAKIANQKDKTLFDALSEMGLLPNGRLSRESLGWLLRNMAGFPVRDLELIKISEKSEYRIREVQ